ncbi:hypothetical protein CVT26_001833 [Gymnopilus dilepis]|uniref:Uncharacterized protein n=1 Tax=Gymnopilus dilepis TaxID=231916 RepID=A0A409X518_9AGAR|nr:hypothetical protein CVT26_001833 [Gymnopilus dilepis]
MPVSFTPGRMSMQSPGTRPTASSIQSPVLPPRVTPSELFISYLKLATPPSGPSELHGRLSTRHVIVDDAVCLPPQTPFNMS